ncbi:MAG: ABC transporter substrate-binding protein [Anaerolineae bacterium]
MLHRIGLVLLALVFLASLAACGAPAATTGAGTEATSAAAGAATTAPASDATAAPTPRFQHTAGRLILATTTSTYDTGLLDYLLPMFEQENGVKVDVISVGSGEAMEIGKRGDADVLLVHSRKAEDAFMAAGDGTRREDVMYNDFVVIGPAADPAGIKGMTAVDAFKKLSETQSEFLARDDKSGTSVKELSIWASAAITPTGAWYVKTGLGMGDTLTMAQEKQAYTVSDRGTYLARVTQGLDLVILVEGDKALLNPYGVITVNPAKNPGIQGDMATKFLEWIISEPIQEKISQFGVDKFGSPLFFPNSAPWKAAHGG